MKQGIYVLASIYGKGVFFPTICGLLYMTDCTNLLTKNGFGNYNNHGD